MATRAELVGILNFTPDSFSDGGLYNEEQQAAARIQELFYQGASIVDIGAESTRPGATPLSYHQERRRLKPLLQSLSVYRGQISIDSYHPENLLYISQNMGEFISNDVTGFSNPNMIRMVARLGLRCIVSHLPREFVQDIQAAHKAKPVDSVEQVRDELLQRRQEMIEAGIRKSKIILDPGIGFGKTRELNWKLLRFGEQVPDADVMIGYSRKRFLGDDRMEIVPNLQAGAIAVEAGAKYLRVHDVAEHRQLLRDMQGA